MKNPLLTTLLIVQALGERDHRLPELVDHFDISLVTVKRSIAEARAMGAQVVAVKGVTWSYHLVNWKDCKKTVQRWIELERSRSLV